MPGKSRRKAKYSVPNKKQVASPGTGTAGQIVEGNAQVNRIVISSEKTAPRIVPDAPRVAPVRSTRGVSQVSNPSDIRIQFVTTELRNIGILAGMMLILLFVLAKVI